MIIISVNKGVFHKGEIMVDHLSDYAKQAFATHEVDYATAISFLQRQTLAVDAPRGYVLLTHRGVPLGFINNLGTRANNLYPKEYRILSQHIPDQEPRVLL